MAIIKMNTLFLNSGRQIKLMGDSICIGPTLEIGEGYSPRLLYMDMDNLTDADISPVSNSYGLTAREWVEVLDYLIQLATQCKTNILKLGCDNPAIFHLPDGKVG